MNNRLTQNTLLMVCGFFVFVSAVGCQKSADISSQPVAVKSGDPAAPNLNQPKPSNSNLTGQPANFSGLWSGRCVVKIDRAVYSDCQYNMSIRQYPTAIYVRATITLAGQKSRMDWFDEIKGNDLGTNESGRGQIGAHALLYQFPTFTLAMRALSANQITYNYEMHRSDRPHFIMSASLLRQ